MTAVRFSPRTWSIAGRLLSSLRRSQRTVATSLLHRHDRQVRWRGPRHVTLPGPRYVATSPGGRVYAADGALVVPCPRRYPTDGVVVLPWEDLEASLPVDRLPGRLAWTGSRTDLPGEGAAQETITVQPLRSSWSSAQALEVSAVRLAAAVRAARPSDLREEPDGTWLIRPDQILVGAHAAVPCIVVEGRGGVSWVAALRP